MTSDCDGGVPLPGAAAAPRGLRAGLRVRGVYIYIYYIYNIL